MMQLMFVSIALASANPLMKCVQLLGDLQQKVVTDGEIENKMFEKFSEWCEDETSSNQYALKTAKAKAESLAAAIEKEASKISSASATIDELAGTVTRNRKDLEAATAIREKERSDFEAADAEMASTIDQITRAIGILRKNLQGTSLVQGSALESVTMALKTVLQASTVESGDKAKLQSLLQDSDDDDFLTRGAPAPEAYKSHSSAIFDTLEDMKDKAKELRNDAQKAEMNAAHAFNMLRQSLENALAVDGKEFDEAKKAKAAAAEAKASAEGDLAMTKKKISETEQYLQDIGSDCQQKAADHEASAKSRQEEIEALAKARKVISDMTGGAEDRTYGFIQVKDGMADTADAGTKVVKKLKELGSATGDMALSQLAMRVRAAVDMGAGADVFAKVRAMIQQLIDKLIADAGQEADHKAWCDKEMGESKEKIEDHQDRIETLGSRVDKAEATIAELAAVIAQTEKDLAEGAKQQASLMIIRKEQKEAFIAAKKDYEDGIQGLTMALKVLREYYQSGETALVQQPETMLHSKSSDASTGIIGLLEVAQADFSKMLAAATVEEDTAQNEFEKLSQEYEVTKAMREADVKYSKKEKLSTEAVLSDLKNDRAQEQAELDAVDEYFQKLAPACIEKPMTYEERKQRRESEIAGLKEALAILAETPSFLAIRTKLRVA